jgi:hypothetical protein
MALHFDSTWASAAELVTVYDQEIARKGLLVRGAQGGTLPANTPCQVCLHVAGEKIFELSASIAAVVPGVGVAVMFPQIPPELTALAERARAGQPLLEPAAEEPKEAAPHGPLTERLKALSVAEKIALAMSCDRETRFALLRDHNKMLHGFVLKNPRIGLDEVAAAAKSPMVSPDALKMIAEHREWGGNPGVCASLVRNPKTPMPLALRLLDKVPMNDLKAIAKGGARDQIVQAARKRLAG